MGHYIDAEKLIAKIERLKKYVESNREYYNNIPLESRNELDAYYAQELILNSLIDTIDSLQQEQPEVDFEKEYKSYMESRKDDLSGNAVTVNMKDLARYFWNKGLNARKE